ncbi:hypothetical protein AB0I34_37570 [Kribbella sp. NPDC050281]|uniref:hypothetical protein n=1 Tax=Kribbella sp. NPDC050281 TaxID=3155515 RepID=UPI0033D691E1
METAELRQRHVELFRTWLMDSGWTLRSQGPLGELLELNDVTVAIPRTLGQDAIVAQGVASRVAQAMGRSSKDVLKRLLSPLTDRIELRLIGTALPSGRVPLGAATEALRNGRRMISASGTSAITPGWSVARRYRPEAQALARDAELAHTEDGSFVFPLYITLERAEDSTLVYDPDSVIPEPFERRVTRTLATALATTVSLTHAPIDELSNADLDDASSVGVSKELCDSLHQVMKSPTVEEVEFNFEWSPAFGKTETFPGSVNVERASRPQLLSLAKRLSRPEPLHSAVYSGPILEIGRGDEGAFFFVLDTYFRERKTRMRVALSEEQHDEAISWYRNRATVLVQGDAKQFKSELLMDAPGRIDAWSQTLF